MTNQVNTEQAVLSAMLLQFTDPTLTQQDACEIVGITPKTYRNWVQSGNEAIETMRELIGRAQREMLVEATSVQLAGLRLLKRDVLKSDVDISERIKGLRYFKEIADELQQIHHAAPGQEEEAHEFLRKGPVTKKQESTFSRLEVRASADGGLTVDMIGHEDVQDADYRDVEPRSLPTNTQDPD